MDLPVPVTDPSVVGGSTSAGNHRADADGRHVVFGLRAGKEAQHPPRRAAIDGIVVPPRATFSFNDSVGPTTLDVGFQWGYGIESGNHWPRTVRSVAGGICRVATTFFQPVFWGGYQLEDRYGHLYRIPEYTSHRVVGLDATVDEDADLDFKWTNTTSNYVLIQGDSDKGNVYFSLYGKKPDWNVKVDDAVITNKTPPDPTPSAQPEPMLPWGKTVLVETARDGFDAEIKRHIIPSDASQERVPDLTSHDEPAQTVTLVGTGGVPSSANVDAAIGRALAAQNTPAPVAKANATPATQPVAVIQQVPTSVVASPAWLVRIRLWCPRPRHRSPRLYRRRSPPRPLTRSQARHPEL